MKTETTTLTNPRGNAAIADAMCDFVHKRKYELCEFADTIAVTEDNWNSAEVTAGIETLSNALEDLRSRAKELVIDILAAADAERIIRQIDPRLLTGSTRFGKGDALCAYAAINARLKAIREKVLAFAEAARPNEPTHTYFYAVTCTDADHMAIQKAMTKAGAKYDVVSPQKDSEWKTAAKLFGVKA